MDYIIYTDGAYSIQHDEGAFAYVICDAYGREVKRGAWKITKETNNRAELKAIIAAIHHLPQDACYAKVVSDSQYALNTLSKMWNRNSNEDLFEAFDRVIASRKTLKIDYEWVRGHSGVAMNEVCDRMCNEVLGYNANSEFDKYRKNNKLP